MQCSVFNLPFQIAIYTRVITATMLFLQFNFIVILRWYCKKQDPRSCPGTITVKVNPLTLKCSSFPCCLYLYFMQPCVDWVLIIFGTQVIKKNGQFGPCFQTIFPFLMTMLKSDFCDQFCGQKVFRLPNKSPQIPRHYWVLVRLLNRL